MRKVSIPVTVSSGNVFADLGLRGAGDLQIKAELTRQLYNRVKKLGLTQVRAAERLGLKQPDVSKLLNGRFTGFSVERLLTLLNDLDIDVEIVLHTRSGKTGKNRKRGSTRVMSEPA